MTIKTYGLMSVDWEERTNFERLRTQRLERIKALLQKSEMGALLCFDMNNIRYITATHIGTWAMDTLARFSLLPQNDEPIMWDFGSAARHHQLYSPWLGERSRAGISTQRGAMAPESGRAEDVARKIRIELEERGLLHEPLGVDVIELPVLFALQAEGIKVVDGQQLMQQARLIKAISDGLVVPVIQYADQLSVEEIAQQRTALVAQAQEGKLRPQDMQHGTFTISNLGMYGIDGFTAIINPPQAAILAVSRISDRVVAINRQPMVQPMMTCSLSCDHRVIDGARGAQFLATLADLLEEPLSLLH